ncbi:hypothetical protein [Nocardioides sp.]|uniref:hypothetical protein n=1 Tax=Nocardioides sp. TaxID=35761 RepID=UPI00260D123A|nr:hypothetical protein [Nocardioides sp.]
MAAKKQAPPAILPTWLSRKDAARDSAVSEWTIDEWLRAGLIRGKNEGRRVLVNTKSLHDHIESLPEAG